MSCLAHVGEADRGRASISPAFSPTPPASGQLWTDVDPDGSIWARGDSWKARFSADGLVYVPLAPEGASIRLRVFDVQVGGSSLAIANRAPVLVSQHEIAVDRGSMTESWTLDPRAIEHAFRFDELASRGEIRVRLSVETPNPPTIEEDGLHFAWLRGSVLYGRASAVDAAGRRVELTSAWVDDGIDIVVPAEFVAAATLPLTIDPVIQTFFVTAPPNNITRIEDAAYDPVGNRWLVVLTQTVTTNDLDVLTRFYDASGNPVAGSDLFLDLTTDSWISPRTAYLVRASSFLTVAELSASGTHSITGRARNGNTLAPKIMISGSETGNKIAAQIGGDPFGGTGASFWCVVWSNVISSFVPGQVTYRMIDQNGVPVGTTVSMLDNAYLGGFPQISKSDGQRDWTVVWQDTPTGAAPHKIRAAQVRWDGTVSTAAHTLLEDPGVDYAQAQVSSPLDAALHTVMSYSARPTGDPLQHVEVANLGSSAALLHTLELGTTQPGEFDTRVDTNGTHAAVIWVNQTGTVGFAVNTLLSEIYDEAGLIGRVTPDLTLEPMLASVGLGACASAHSSGAVSQRYILCWNSHATFGELDCALFDGVMGGPVTSYCSGNGSGTVCPCGNNAPPSTVGGCLNSFGLSARLVANGAASTTNDTLVLVATNTPPTGQAPTFVQGTTQTNGGLGGLFGDGLRCTSGTQIRLGTVPSSGGTASFGFGIAGTPLISVRGVIPSAGAVRNYQVLYRNSAAFCTTATFNLTNGVNVVWTP